VLYECENRIPKRKFRGSKRAIRIAKIKFSYVGSIMSYLNRVHLPPAMEVVARPIVKIEGLSHRVADFG
jgi:hypothetical protein